MVATNRVGNMCWCVCCEHIFWKSAPLITSISNAWKRKKCIKAFNKNPPNIHSTGWIVIIYSDFLLLCRLQPTYSMHTSSSSAYKISMSPKLSRWAILFSLLCGHVYVYENFKIILTLGLKLLLRLLPLLLTPLFIFGECIRLIDSKLWRVVTGLDFYEWKLSLCLWFIENIHTRTRKRVRPISFMISPWLLFVVCCCYVRFECHPSCVFNSNRFDNLLKLRSSFFLLSSHF